MKTVQTINQDFDSSLYNKHALHPMQSWEWGQARGSMGIDVLRVGEFDGGSLTSVFQITFHRLPHTSYTIGYLPRSKVPSRQVVQFLTTEARKRSCIFIKIEPYVKDAHEKWESEKNIPLKISSHALFPPWTRIIDLSPSIEDLFSRLKPKTRYNVRVAQRQGVQVREETTESGFATFAKLYFQTCRRQKYHGHTMEYHKKIFSALKSTQSHVYIAYYKGEPLAAYHIFIFNNRAYYVYGGSSFKHRRVMASTLLMWKSIEFAKSKNAQVFDMWGSLGPNYESSHPWAGFTRFKEGFGGELLRLEASRDMVLQQSLYTVYNILHKVRSVAFTFR